MPYLVFAGQYDTMGATAKMFMSLCLNSCMGIGVHILADLEASGKGICCVECEWEMALVNKNKDSTCERRV